MKVWQPGSHLSEARGGEVRDWSWKRTRTADRAARAAGAPVPRPHRTLARNAARVHGRRARTAVPGEARDRPGHQGARPQPADLDHRDLLRRRPAGARTFRREHLFDRLGRRAHPRRSPEQALRPPGAALTRLLRAEPGRRRYQPDYERRRGARSARHRRRHQPDPEHPAPGRHRRRPLLPRLAARAGDDARTDPDGADHDLVPQPLQPGLPPCPRAARPRHGDARRRHRRHARRPVLHARAGAAEGVPRRQRSLPRRELRDDDPERDLLPGGRPARLGRDRDRLRLRRLARLPRRDDRGDALRLRALPLELLRPDPAALAALQHIPLRDRGARQDHRRTRRGAAGRRPGRRRNTPAHRGAGALRERALRLRPRVPRGAARARARRPGRDHGGARRAHRCRQIDDREAARPLLRSRPRGGSRSTGSTCAR